MTRLTPSLTSVVAALAALALGLAGLAVTAFSVQTPTDPTVTSTGWGLLFCAGALAAVTVGILRRSRLAWVLAVVLTGLVALVVLMFVASPIVEAVQDMVTDEPAAIYSTSVYASSAAAPSLADTLTDLIAEAAGYLVAGGSAAGLITLLMPSTRRDLRQHGPSETT